jgi:hypothetical protein
MKFMTRAMFALAVSLAATSPTKAAFEPLSEEQLRILFGDGLNFHTNPNRSDMTFRFGKRGNWTGEKDGTEQKGSWEISGNALCMYFDILRRGSPFRFFFENAQGCSTIERQKDIFVHSRSGIQFIPEDRSVVDRVLAAAPKSAAEELAAERERIAEERRELEQLRASVNQSRQPQEADRVAAAPDVAFGTYHALVVGIDDYESLPKLKTALADARAVATLLETKYEYRVRLLENATRSEIIDALDEYRDSLGPNDNLLIYYAGHGWLDKETQRGYWLPRRAQPDRRSRWISNASLADALLGMNANHVMVVADSCYAGTLTRSLTEEPDRSNDYFRRMAEKRTRVVISSGGLEPVVDSGGGSHSVFAAQFIKVLEENRVVLDGTGLFETIRRAVVLNADQTPQYSDIRHAGHEGGDFLFVPRN